MRKIFAALLVAVVVSMVIVAAGGSGQREVKTYVLFAGNVDSTEQVSRWFPIYRASRVMIRTYSGKAAFHASTDADSQYSDSIATWRTLFSDSICCYAAGFPSAGDSTMITGWGIDSVKQVAVIGPPVNKPLRAPGNGSGYYTTILPTGVLGSVAPPSGPERIMVNMMRLRITPHRRLTVTGFSSTEGVRVNGLKQLKVIAYVEFD